MLDFRSYYQMFFRQFWEDARPWARDNIFWGAAVVVFPPVIVWWRHHQHYEFDWELLRTTLQVYALVFAIYLVAHLIRTPWKLHKKHADLVELERTELQNKNSELEAFKKSVEAEEVHLEPVGPLFSISLVPFNDGQGARLCLRATLVNNRKPGIPGKIAEKVAANITYFDVERAPFTVEGRWVRTNQPASYTHLQDKTEILRVDFHPGAKHELDIANKNPRNRYCYAVAYDNLEERMLLGPRVKVKIELIAKHVNQVFECIFEIPEDELRILDS